jgi:uncharacterized LabA/DUF88 family protein
LRTFVYIDGLNLYYRAVRGSPHKWLDIASMSQAVLPASCTVARINYYTAHVSGRLDPQAPARQNAYLRALSTLPNVAIHFGKFLVSEKWSGFVTPPQDYRPQPKVALVWKTEEKGSDVNLGVHLVRDAFKGAFEHAAVLTNDTDLCGAVEIVTQEVGLPVTLLTPMAKPATSLARLATHVRHIQPYLGPCQLPNPVIGKNGKQIAKPVTW